MSWLLFPLLAFALEGRFVQDCRSALQREEAFLGDTVVYTETNYRDRFCQFPELTLKSYGIFELGALVPVPDGAQEMNFKFGKVTLTVHSEDIAIQYRQRKLCGMVDWAQGLEMNITGRYCDFFYNGSPVAVPAYGSWRYGIIKFSEEGLFLGRLSPEEDAMAPDRHPKDLDPAPYRPAP